MEAYESNLRTFLFSAPKWMQLEIQGFFYGLISTSLSYKEENNPFTVNEKTVETLLLFADPEFEGWPTSWLEPFLEEFLKLDLTLEQLNTHFSNLDTLFRDCVPTDLDIFTTYANGETLTDEQWLRLHDALAFLPPPLQQTKRNTKTRHIHGRRSVTPMRNRKAITLKKQKYSFVKLQ